MTTDACPLIDLAPFYANRDVSGVAAAIDTALRETGFFMVVNHPVPAPLLADTRAICREFFDLPMPGKMAIRNTAAGSHRGYVPFGESALAFTYGGSSPPDLKESFGMGPIDLPAGQGASPYYSPNVWPAEPARFHRLVADYYRQMERLTADLTRLFAQALHLAPDFFDDKFRGHNSTLRVLNYPEQSGPPLPGQLRAGAHTDYGVLTILMGDDAPGGLQVRTRAGEWRDVVPPGDAFVINIGDLMMYWSNDAWLSNVHRVANPPPGYRGPTRRQSIAFFANPREDALIECIPTCVTAERPALHPPVRAGEHRMKKIRAAAEQREAVAPTAESHLNHTARSA